MPDHVSVLARKLREYRATHGRHGRMTQEELAELLGVSVDAVGKYERSVSYLRGDLEHRLVERLGWSREDVRACREDWDIRRHRPRADGYRLLDEELLSRHFGGSWTQAARATVDFSGSHMPDLPQAFEAALEIFVPISVAFPDHWATVMRQGRIVANWALPFLLPEDVELFRSRRLVESSLSHERIHRPILPGKYFGYCTALVVAHGHEAASPLLLSSVVSFLEKLADREVLLEGIGTVSVSPSGAQVCRDLGMLYLGRHRVAPALGVWELPGSAIADSIFGRRSRTVRRVYAAEFAG